MRKGISDRAFAFILAALVCAIAFLVMFPAKSRGDELSDKTLIASLAAENMQLRARIAQLEARLSAVSTAPLMAAPVYAGACSAGCSGVQQSGFYSMGACGQFASAGGCGQSAGACGQASAGACGAADSGAGACGQSGGDRSFGWRFRRMLGR